MKHEEMKNFATKIDDHGINNLQRILGKAGAAAAGQTRRVPMDILINNHGDHGISLDEFALKEIYIYNILGTKR